MEFFMLPRPLTSLPAAALMAVALLGTTACVQNRTIGSTVDDTTSDVSIKTKLLQDGKYDYSDVDVTVFEGRMMLTGTMRTADGRDHVVRLANKATNVTEVLDEIVVGGRTSTNQGLIDGRIDVQLATALRFDNGVKRGNYQIAVSNGVVYLLGVAQGPNELKRATDHARTINGVTKVVSHVIYVGDPRRATRAP